MQQSLSSRNAIGYYTADNPPNITLMDYRNGSTCAYNIGFNGNGLASSPNNIYLWRRDTSPTTTTSKMVTDLQLVGSFPNNAAIAGATFEVDTVGNVTPPSNGFIQAQTGQFAVRSKGGTIFQIMGISGGGGIDRTYDTTNITQASGVYGFYPTNSSTSGATITDAYGVTATFTASVATRNNYAIFSQGPQVFLDQSGIDVMNASGVVGPTGQPIMRFGGSCSNVQTCGVSVFTPNSAVGPMIKFIPQGSTHTNWEISDQNLIGNGFEITPSTAAGGFTFSNPAISILQNGNGGTLNIFGSTSGSSALNAPATAGVTNTLPSTAGTLTATVASGTAAMTTAAITAGNCGTTVTVAAANVATTDTIKWAFNAAPAGSNAGVVSMAHFWQCEFCVLSRRAGNASGGNDQLGSDSMRRLTLAFVLLLMLPAMAQNGRYDSVALGPKGSIPRATVAVCTQPANTGTAPCTPIAALCSSLTDTSCTSPNPLTADSLGNFNFYAKPSGGPYTIQIYGPQVAAPVAFPDQGVGGTTGLVSASTINNVAYVDGVKNTTIAQAITAAGSGGTVIVPPGCASSSVAPSTVSISAPITLILQCNIASNASPNISVLSSGTVITGSGANSNPAQNGNAITWTNSGTGFTIQIGDGTNAYRGLVVEKLNFSVPAPAVANDIKIKANVGDVSFRDIVTTGIGFDGSDGNSQLIRFERVRVNKAVNQGFNFNCTVICNSISFQSTYADVTSGTGTGYDLGNTNATLNATDSDSGVCGYKWEGSGQAVAVGSDDEANSTAGWCITGTAGNVTLVSAKTGAEVLPFSITGAAAVTIINPFTTATSGANSINVAATGTGQNLLIADSGLDKPITVASGGVLQRMGSLTNVQGPLTLLNVNSAPGITVPIDTVSIGPAYRISDTHSGGCNWDLGEIFGVATLDLRATSCGGGGLGIRNNSGAGRAILNFTNSADQIVQFPSGTSATVMTAALTTTAATTDNVTVTGMTASGHCSLEPTNSGAAGGIAGVFVSAKTTNQITVTHAATAGWTFDVLCTSN